MTLITAYLFIYFLLFNVSKNLANESLYINEIPFFSVLNLLW